MKIAVSIVLMISISLFLSGCFIEDDMRSDIVGDIPVIGWITGAALDKNNVDSMNKITDEDGAAKNNSGTLKDVMKDAPKVKCPAHQYWNQLYYTCMCEADYYMQDGVCIAKSSRQCVVDRDCSPDGSLSKCVSATAKRIYICNPNTYTCVGGKGLGSYVDCKEDFGPNAKCLNGNCVS